MIIPILAKQRKKAESKKGFQYLFSAIYAKLGINSSLPSYEFKSAIFSLQMNDDGIDKVKKSTFILFKNKVKEQEDENNKKRGSIIVEKSTPLLRVENIFISSRWDTLQT